MFTVTEKAQQQIAKYFEENEIKPIRVFPIDGCGGPQISMALDQQKTNDHAFEFGGFQFLVDKDFLAQAQPIKIDFTGNGFIITTPFEMGQG